MFDTAFARVQIERVKDKCLTKGCKATARTRGLCSACYQISAYAVGQGKTSWAKLERAGRANPSRQYRRRNWSVPA